MEPPKARVTILVENTAKGPRLLAEHGLAYWIEYAGHWVLFDTGQGYALQHNATELGIALSSVEAIVLSHGHYDHTGGIAEAVSGSQPVKVFGHPAAFRPKFARRGDARPIGIPSTAAQSLRGSNVALHHITKPTMILPGLMATGPIPRMNEIEQPNSHFFLDEACRTIDPLEDDQALFFTTSQGIVILLGCAHAGVINTIRYIEKLLPAQVIHALIGGMHLVEASHQQIQWTLDELEKRRISLIAPVHCTGTKATIALWQRFPDQCHEASVGTRWEFDFLPTTQASS